MKTKLLLLFLIAISTIASQQNKEKTAKDWISLMAKDLKIPKSEIEQMVYNHKGKKIMDMSCDKWADLGHEKQWQYAAAYQKAYAKSINRPVEKTFYKTNPDNDQALVYVTGKATTKAILKDELFNISANVLKLKRTVKMYQWKEEKTDTTYKYKKIWSQHLIDSTKFKQKGYNNPTTMPYKSKTSIARTIRVGAFRLSKSLISQLTNFEPLKLNKLGARLT